jgi:ribosomal protein S18 acetylase RimI-like enzyme
MYKQYLKERENKEVLETEQGFAVYGYNCIPGVDFPHVYIQDIWVKPEFRKNGVARVMADGIAADAKQRGFRLMIGSFDCGAKGANESMLVLVAYGMKPYTANNGTVFMIKEI